MMRKEDIRWTVNGIGRDVPVEIGGKLLRPYSDHLGIEPGSKREVGRPIRHRMPGEDKVLKDIMAVLRKVELSDGMSISFHHHLRNGDRIVNMVMDAIKRGGIKDITVLPTALFPVHEPLIERIKDGTIARIEGSLNGPLGRYVTMGNMDLPIILRSHSGRSRALSHGEIKIDVAFLGVSSCDSMGNANGVNGPSAFGPCSFLRGDAHFAEKTVLITDHLVPYPCSPISIPATDVDLVLEVSSIGDPAGILSGSLEIASDPVSITIMDHVMSVLKRSDLLKDGFSFQAGSGGISLGLTQRISDLFFEKGLVASYAVGGTTRFLVEMLEKGHLRKLLDGQSFDPISVQSLRTNRDHVELFVDQYCNPYSGGTVTENEQASFLSATEVDLDFNLNVNTHSDGWLLHGIGGHQDVAYGSQMNIVTVPLLRKGNPIIKERVLTVSTPGKLIDLIVCEKGMAFNTMNARPSHIQRNEDLEIKCKKEGLPVMSVEDLRNQALKSGGMDIAPMFGEGVVALVKYIDGTVLDHVRSLK